MFTIAPATDWDRDALRQLHHDSWAVSYASFVPQKALTNLQTDMAARWCTLPHGVICARQEGHVIGFIRLKRRQGWPYIDNLHTQPHLRSQGVGAALLGAAMTELRAQGEGRVWLTVIAANWRARHFYGRHGGVEAGPMIEPVLDHPTHTRAVIWTRLRGT